MDLLVTSTKPAMSGTKDEAQAILSRPDALRVPVLRACKRHDTGDGELVLYSEARDQLLVLNPIAAGIVWLIDGQRTLGDIVSVLLGAQPIDPLQAYSDVSQFVESLHNQGLVAFDRANDC